MKKLSPTATRVFAALLNSISQDSQRAIVQKGTSSLAIKNLQIEVKTAYGKGVCHALVQLYTGEESPLRDPLMHFIVVDARTRPDEFERLQIFPYYLLENDDEAAETSILVIGEHLMILLENKQAEHAYLADEWMEHIQLLGFVD